MVSIEIAENILHRMRHIIALMLWDAGAIKVNLNEPFRLVSGNYSPIYVNCRALISNPSAMDIITASIRYLLVNFKITADVIAGGETAGIPFASFVSQKIDKPMVYVRKESKEHGLKTAVEGMLLTGLRVVLIEDLITDGKSKVSFIQGIRKAGGEIRTCVVVFDRNQGGSTLLVNEGVELFSLTDLNTALELGKEAGILAGNQCNEVQHYLVNPADWHASRGLNYSQ